MEKNVLVSVIIPCYNSRKMILETLKALEKQKTDFDFEIIICDDGSKDGTPDLVKEFLKKSKLKIRIFENEHHGPAWQRNFGAKNAKGEIVVFTDSDCVPEENWLTEMVKPILNGKAVGVQGTYNTLNPQYLVARFEGYDIEKRHRKMEKSKKIDFIGTFAAAYKKDVFLKFGGFDESFETASGEDPELSYRMVKAGYTLLFNPRAVVKHPHSETLKVYLKRQLRHAYWRVFMYFKHHEKMKGDSYTGVEVPLSFFFAFLSLFCLLISPFIHSALLITCIFALLVIGVNIDTVMFMAKKERKMLIIAPLIILLRSYVWVFGAIRGLLSFLKQKIYT